jgi:4-aminobutyrate aminotransferase-like enzyme
MPARVGLAVLEVIKDENLEARALQMGEVRQ